MPGRDDEFYVGYEDRSPPGIARRIRVTVALVFAVGLTIAAEHRFPDFAPAVTTIVLASVASYEMFGPISTRWALMQSGESRHLRPDELVI